MRSNVRFVATKKGMSAALALAAYKNPELFSVFIRSADKGRRRAVGPRDRRGEIRDDISPEDLLRALVGMCYLHDQPGWQTSVLRLSTSSSTGCAASERYADRSDEDRIDRSVKHPPQDPTNPSRKSLRCFDREG